MKKKEIVFQPAPGRAHAVIAEFSRFVRCVPTLKNHIEVVGSLCGSVGPKPAFLDQASPGWRGRLLILSGKVIGAHPFRCRKDLEEVAQSPHAREPDDVGEIQTTPSSVSFAVTSDSTSLDVPGESCLRNPLREICTVGSVREEIPVVPWWT